MERWRDIPGYEGIYQASTHGNIRSCEGKVTRTKHHGARHWKQRTLKQKRTQDTKGRTDARVNLWKDGKSKTWLVSRLVALTWCDGYGEGLTVNHIDGNPSNNNCSNLEWVTRRENIKKAVDAGLYDGIMEQIALKQNEKVHVFNSMREASHFLGRDCGYVSNCLKLSRAITDANGNLYTVLPTRP